MQSLPVNALDIAILAILLVSGFFALVRGFVREVLSVAGWVGAALATAYLFEPARPFARDLIPSALLADIATGAAIFVLTLVSISIVSHLIAERVRGSMIGPVDRSLGFVFGLFRGAVLCCAAFLLFAWLVPTEDRPAMVTSARALPLLERGGELLLNILPESARKDTQKAVGLGAERVKDAAAGAAAVNRAGEALKGVTGADSGKDKGYKTDERRALDNLIRGSQ